MKELTEGERTLALACTLVRVLEERYQLPGEEMKLACSIALQVNLMAEGGNADALAIVHESTEKMRQVMREVLALRASQLDPDSLN